MNYLIVNDDEGTAIFDYSADESDQTWTLLYEDFTGICSDSDSKIKDVNTDYIDANFTVDPSVICEASEFVLIDNTLSVVDDDFYIFSWEIYNGLEIEYSAQDSLSPTFSLPSPGLYDIKLEVISSTGCSDVLDSLEVVRDQDRWNL